MNIDGFIQSRRSLRMYFTSVASVNFGNKILTYATVNIDHLQKYELYLIYIAI